jgi:Ca-activated chloride channel family protein
VTFYAPALLVLLLLVPAAVAAYWWFNKNRDRRVAPWATPTLVPNMVKRPTKWRRHLPVALLLVGVTLLLVGFARPAATLNVKRQEATVILVLDVSGSMAAKDSFPTRIAAAKALALKYVDSLPKGYRVSVITFSDHAAVTVAPTEDLDHARAVIEKAKTGPQGTALADAVQRGVDVAKAVKGSQKGAPRPPAVVVVFSDGGQTAGRVTPQQAAVAASRAKIPVSTVALGTPDGVVLQQLQGGFTERIQVPVQPQVLQGIARISGGTFTQGAANVDVKRTYSELGSRTGTKRKKVEVTAVTAAGGMAFMLAGALVSGLWFRRVV